MSERQTMGNNLMSNNMMMGSPEFAPSSVFTSKITVSPQASVSALCRTGRNLDCYVCGLDGGAYCNWWSANEDNGSWHSWFRIGEQWDVFPQNTTFTPVARSASNLCLFAVGQDGGVYCSWCDMEFNSARWNPWFRIGGLQDVFPPQSTVTAIARTPDRLDIFVIGQDGCLYSTWCEQRVDNGQWHAWFRIGSQYDVFPALTKVTAVACNSNRLDIFAVGQDGGVYSAWWDCTLNNAYWNSWFRIGGPECVFPQQTCIAAVARKSQQVDIFATGYDGGVYWNSWNERLNGASWNSWQRIGNVSSTFPQCTTITAVSRSEDRLDLFAVGYDGMVYSCCWHQYSNNSRWGDWYRIGHESETFPQSGKVAACARNMDHLDLFTIGYNGGIYTTSWDLYEHEGRWLHWSRI